MGQVAITLNDRTYRLVCDDGEEDRLVDLAGYVKAKIERLQTEVGHVGDERLMLMAALMIADELFDAKADAKSAREMLIAAGSVSGQVPGQLQGDSGYEPEAVKRLRTIAAKMAAEPDGLLRVKEAAAKEQEVTPKQTSDRTRRRNGVV